MLLDKERLREIIIECLLAVEDEGVVGRDELADYLTDDVYCYVQEVVMDPEYNEWCGPNHEHCTPDCWCCHHEPGDPD